MLNDWGVHHLHISTQVGVDGYVRRGGPLLFPVFRPQVAYLIDIMGHRDWTRHHVLEMLATEWPNEGAIHDLGCSQSQRSKNRGGAGDLATKTH
jgi:hypothetical protein